MLQLKTQMNLCNFKHPLEPNKNNKITSALKNATVNHYRSNTKFSLKNSKTLMLFKKKPLKLSKLIMLKNLPPKLNNWKLNSNPNWNLTKIRPRMNSPRKLRKSPKKSKMSKTKLEMAVILPEEMDKELTLISWEMKMKENTSTKS